MKYTIGVDFGTRSCRAIVLRAADGKAVGLGECAYQVFEDALPSGVPLPPRAALADPDEYIAALCKAVREAVQISGADASDIMGIAVDATTMSMLCCDESGTPLCRYPEYSNVPDAYIRLWKCYTATDEAARISRAAREEHAAFLDACGGHPSSEGIYPKALETLRDCPALYRDSYAFVDLNEWLNWQMTGTLTRSAGSMGMKNYCADGRTLPPAAFFARLDPRMADINDKLHGKALFWGERAGDLTPAMAERLGLKAGIAVAAGGLDGHTSMMALGLKSDGEAMMTIGTSGVLAIISDTWNPVPGICGQAKDALTPGFYGYDFCQSGVGDMFAWFVDNCLPARYEAEARARGLSPHTLLSEKGFAHPPQENGLVAVDWWNGSRSLVVDQTLRGAIDGFTLQTKPEDIYRALIEAAAFGIRALREQAEAYGVAVRHIRVCGGIAGKNPYLMQCYADILGMPLSVSPLPNTAAAGSAIGAAAAAGLYATLSDAMAAMANDDFTLYTPNPANKPAYDALYKRYMAARGFLAAQST